MPFELRPDFFYQISGPPFDAGLAQVHHRPHYILSKSSNILSIKSFVIDTVVELIPPLIVSFLGHTTDSGWEEYITWLGKCCNLVIAHAADLEQSKEIVFLLLTCGRAASSAETFDRTLDVLQEILDFVLLSDSIGQAQRIREEERIRADLNVFTTAASAGHAACRSVCVTTAGRLSLVPPVAKVGDMICIIPRGDTPYVISDCGQGHFNLVGECYVQGIMHGEALKMGLPERWIELC